LPTSRLMTYSFDPGPLMDGPTLEIRPEELDRLDISHHHHNNHRGLRHDSVHSSRTSFSGSSATSLPSINFNPRELNQLEASIDATLQSYRTNAARLAERLGTEDPADRGIYQQMEQNYLPPTMASPPQAAPIQTPNYPSGQGFYFTPPASDLDEKKRAQLASANVGRFAEDRADQIRREEQNKVLALKSEYQQQLSKVQQDLETLLRHQEQVIKLKNEVEHGLQAELELIRKDLLKEQDLRRSERIQHDRLVKQLKEELTTLQGGRYGLNRGYRNTNHTNDSHQRHEAEIRALIQQCERDKSAAIQMTKAKMRAQVSMLIPKIKAQCLDACREKMLAWRDQLHQECNDRLNQAAEEHRVELKIVQRQHQEQLDQTKTELAAKLRAKYELKLMQVRNECERRILQRLDDRRR